MSIEIIYFVAASIAIFFIFVIIKPLFKNYNNSDSQSSSLTTSQVQAQQEDFLPHYVPARVNTNELPPPYYH